MIVKINYKEELKGDIKETYQKLEQQQKKWTDDNKEKKKQENECSQKGRMVGRILWKR